MKRVVLILLLFSFKAQAQNLVPNPSFENYISCDSLNNGIWLHNFPPWDRPSNGSFDGFNTCSITANSGVPFNVNGWQQPHTGNGYVGGMFANWMNNWEYLQVELDAPLIAQEYYCASFYISTADRNGLACNNIGIYFSDIHTFVPSGLYLNFTPQINDTNVVSDTANWTIIYGQYRANGGERYIILGDFFPNSLTDTMQLHGNGTGDTYYYIDDVNVHCCTCDSTSHLGVGELKEEDGMSIYPNPCGNELRIRNYELGIKNAELRIYDVLGEVVRSFDKLRMTDGSTTIDVSGLAKGVYFVEVTSTGSVTNVVRKKFVKE